MEKIKRVMKDRILLLAFINALASTFSYPFMHSFLISGINSKMISVSELIVCIGGVTAPMLWNKKNSKLLSKFGLFLLLESIACTTIIVLVSLGKVSAGFYYVADAILFAVITNNLVCGGNALNAIKYIGKDREVFDNNRGMVSNIAAVIGYSLSIVFTVSPAMAFTIFAVGLNLANILYFIEYKDLAAKIKLKV